MNLNVLTFLIVSVICFHSYSEDSISVTPAIQRYDVVGASDDGLRIAIMMTHFGPSSLAPFANLYVFESGKSTSLFHDSAFMASGGENELAELSIHLYNANKQKLLQFGINSTNPLYGDANYILLETHQPENVSGVIDIENIDAFNFYLKFKVSNICNDTSLASLELKLGHKILNFEPKNNNECGIISNQLRTIIRTKSAAWFVYMQQFDSLGIPSYKVKVAGVSW